MENDVNLDELDLKRILKLYPEYDYAFGPYVHNQTGRKIIRLATKAIRTIPYPRALMEIHLGRRLEKDETVDHIDGNFNNNHLSNLQLLSQSEHSKMDNRRVLYISPIICPMCGTEFTPSNKRINGKKDYDLKRAKRKTPFFCSRKCVGKYGKKLQTDPNFQRIEQQTLTIIYGKLKDLNKLENNEP